MASLKNKIMMVNYGPVRRSYPMYPEVLVDIMLFNLRPDKFDQVKLMDLPELQKYTIQFLLTELNSGIKASPTVLRRAMNDIFDEVKVYKPRKD